MKFLFYSLRNISQRRWNTLLNIHAQNFIKLTRDHIFLILIVLGTQSYCPDLLGEGSRQLYV